jgi:hypothetical protein
VVTARDTLMIVQTNQIPAGLARKEPWCTLCAPGISIPVPVGLISREHVEAHWTLTGQTRPTQWLQDSRLGMNSFFFFLLSTGV